MTAAPCGADRATPATLPSSSEPRSFAMNANQQIDAAIQHLLSALNTAADDATRFGATDTGARRAAAALLDARISVHQAITAAGRALADRERTVDVQGTTAPTAIAA
jgi:hypothetical protein